MLTFEDNALLFISNPISKCLARSGQKFPSLHDVYFDVVSAVERWRIAYENECCCLYMGITCIFMSIWFLLLLSDLVFSMHSFFIFTLCIQFIFIYLRRPLESNDIFYFFVIYENLSPFLFTCMFNPCFPLSPKEKQFHVIQCIWVTYLHVRNRCKQFSFQDLIVI